MINSGETPSDNGTSSDEEAPEITANDGGEDISTSVEGTAPTAPPAHRSPTMARSGPNTVPQGDL